MEPETSPAETEKPRHAGFAYALGRSLITPLARTIYRPRIEGRENVPVSYTHLTLPTNREV